MMVEKSASPASIAARFNVTEQAVQWLLDNRNSGGEGDGETAELLKKLYIALVSGASANPSAEPWDDTLIYSADVSMHVAVFGTNYSNAVKCMDGKGLYGRVFSDNENRWAGTGSTFDKALANEIFGLSDTGYIDRIRSQNFRSLAQAVFKTSANIVSGKTIIDRIAEVQTNLDELADNAESAINSLSTSFNSFRTTTTSRLASIESRLAAGGL